MISINKINKYALTAAVAVMPLAAGAQLKESVQVRGEYQKEILYPDKLGSLPRRIRPATPPSDIPYALQGVDAEFVPSSMAIPATSYGACRPGGVPRGYLSLAIGSWLNSRLAAGVTILNNHTRTLNFHLRHASTSLWHPYKDDYKEAGEKAPRRFSYQESIGLDWTERINEGGELHAAVDYRFGYFNYYGLRPAMTPLAGGAADAPLRDAPKLPERVVNDFSARVGYASIPSAGGEADRNRWSADLGVRHLRYNLAAKETHLRLSGDYARMFGDSRDNGLSYPSTLGMELVADALLYGKSSFTPRYEPRVPALIFDNYDVATSNYGNLRLSPYYYWNNGSLGLRAGVNLDLTFNADAAAPNGMVLSDGHYNLFHISPDVRFDYSAGRFAAYIHATGGQEAVTLASIADRNLYSMPYLQSTTPVFVPVDAKIGFRVNPVAGLKFEVAAGYRITRNVPFCGWDMPVMNAVYAPASYSLPVLPVAEGDIATYGLGAGRYNLSGLYVDLNVGYKIGKALDLHAAMQYTPQNVGHGIFNGADRPRWILTPGVEVKPTDALTIGVDYEYRGVRSVWSGMARSIASRAEGNGGGTSVGPGSGSISEVTPKSNSDAVGMRLPDIARLNAHAVYRFGDFGGVRNFSLGVAADNLLNHNDILLPGLPSEGLSISGIIRMEF